MNIGQLFHDSIEKHGIKDTKFHGEPALIFLLSFFLIVAFPLCRLWGNTKDIVATSDGYQYSGGTSSGPGGEGKLEDLRVGYNSQYGEHFAVLKFEDILSKIPSGSTINSAQLNVYYFDAYDAWHSRYVHAYRATENWTESNITWNQPLGDWSTLQNTQLVVATSANAKKYTWDITPLTRNWFNGTWANQGVLLSHSDVTSINGRLRFYSMNCATASYRPTLHIDYTLPVQLTNFSIVPTTQDRGKQITVSYSINNPNSSSATVGLGCSIKPVGSAAWKYSDPAHDITVTASSGTSTKYRYFDIPSNADVCAYTVGCALWDGIPGASNPLTNPVLTKDILTVKYAAPTIDMISPASDTWIIQGGTVPISWEGTTDAEAKVWIGLDTDNVSSNGTVNIVLFAQNVDGSVEWNNTSNITPGVYYIYGKIDDNINPPVYDYAAGKVTIQAPLTLIDSGCSISHSSANLMSTITVSYTVQNTNPFSVNAGLGFSIAPVGTTNWIDNISNDKIVSFPANQTKIETRDFYIPLSASPGTHTCWFGLWSGTPGTSTRYDDVQKNLLTVLPPNPVISRFDINNGAAETNSLTVTLNNTCTNTPTHYMASENSSFTGASWQTYSSSSAPSFILSSGNGAKTVYFKVKNDGGESAVRSDTINLIIYGQVTATLNGINGGYQPTASTVQFAIGSSSGSGNPSTVSGVLLNTAQQVLGSQQTTDASTINPWQERERWIDQNDTFSQASQPRTYTRNLPYGKTGISWTNGLWVTTLGTAMTPRIQVQNDTGTARTITIDIRLSQAKNFSSLDYNGTKDYTIPANSSQYVDLPAFSATSTGEYYGAYRIRTQGLTGGTQTTDTGAWYNVLTVSQPTGTVTATLKNISSSSYIPQNVEWNIGGRTGTGNPGTITNVPTGIQSVKAWQKGNTLFGIEQWIDSTYNVTEGTPSPDFDRNLPYTSINVYRGSEVIGPESNVLVGETLTIKLTIYNPGIVSRSAKATLRIDQNKDSTYDYPEQNYGPIQVNSGSSYPFTYDFTVNKPGDYNLCYAVYSALSSWALTDSCDWQHHITARANTGEVTATLKQIDGTSNLDAGKTRFDLGGVYHNGENPYTFSNISPGTYTLKGYSSGSAQFGPELWAMDSVTVATGVTTPITLIRKMPWVEEIRFYNKDTNAEITSGQIEKGKEIRAEIKIKNATSSVQVVRAHLLMDNDMQLPYDPDLYSSTNGQSINANSSLTVPINFTPASNGQYYRKVEIATVLDGNWVCTDGWEWGQVFRVIPPRPVITTYAINNGAAETYSRTVTLNNTCTNTPTYYRASEDSSFTGASWIAYTSLPTFDLSPGDGTKTVYFQVKNDGGESDWLGDYIILKLPAIEVQYSGVIPCGNNTPNFEYGTYFASALVNKETDTKRHYFTITNTGTGILSLQDNYITLTGSDVENFTISGLTQTTINSGQSAVFTITFAPKSALLKTATVHIFSNDPDPAKRDYSFTVQGVGIDKRGVTIITHGWLLGGSDNYVNYPKWPKSMAQAILVRAYGSDTKGNIFINNTNAGSVNYGNWEPCADFIDNRNQPDEEIILLFDWACESGRSQNGWLEAAADSLFALLAKPLTLKNVQVNLLDRPIHFIGHSRGAVLNSQVINRIGYYFTDTNTDPNIEQATSLDPHPWSTPEDIGYITPDSSVNSYLNTYTNTLWADNYYRQDGGENSYEVYIPKVDFDFNGVRANGAYNLYLDDKEVLQGGYILDHSNVHLWYYGTITEPFPSSNYEGYSGSNRNYNGDIGITGKGDFDAYQGKWYGSGNPDSELRRDIAGFNYSRIGGGIKKPDPNFGKESYRDGTLWGRNIFNGGFDYGFVPADFAPGWNQHGGTIICATIKDYNLNTNRDLTIEKTYNYNGYAKHNLFYIPQYADRLAFDFDVTVSTFYYPHYNDYLSVMVGSDEVVGIVKGNPINLSYNRKKLCYVIEIPEKYRGCSTSIEFQLKTRTNRDVTANVRIDNIKLLREDEPGSISGDSFTFTPYVAGSGTVHVNGSGTFLPVPSDHADGAVIQVEARPNDGWVFSRWAEGGDLTGTDNPATLIMSSNKSATAVFLLKPYEPPILKILPSSEPYLKDNGKVVIDAHLTVADADSATLNSATVWISDNYAGGQDYLGFTDQNGIAGSFDGVNGTLTLTGQASVSAYESALRSITYTNTSLNSNSATRTLSFMLNDGTVDSQVSTNTINLSSTLLAGDSNGDETINLEDFAVLSSSWMANGCSGPDWCNGADLNHDGLVNQLDLVIVPAHLLISADDLGPAGIVFVTIPAGSFQMGDSLSEGDDDEKPVHTVTLDSFKMSRHEITNGQYAQFLNEAKAQGLITEDGDGVIIAVAGGEAWCDTVASSSHSQIINSGGVYTVKSRDGQPQDSHPVVCVSWAGAKAFCDFYGYQLPTEAQWEYSARGGLTGKRFPWNDLNITHNQANYKSSTVNGYDISVTRGYHPTYSTGTLPYTSPVGSFASNGYGLCDMADNVWEWCSDGYGPYSAAAQTNPTGAAGGQRRVMRGGSWYYGAYDCRVASRNSSSPTGRSNYRGFRVCKP